VHQPVVLVFTPLLVPELPRGILATWRPPVLPGPVFGRQARPGKALVLMP